MKNGYAVVDDGGEDGLTAELAFESRSKKKVLEWAEANNYHSASIVKLTNGVREVIGP